MAIGVAHVQVPRKAAEYGWIREEAVARVAPQVERDRERPDPLGEVIRRPPRSS